MATTYVKSDERRVQLVQAARKVLDREGMAGTSLRAVAGEANVPIGTVYYVFPSKESLLKAVLEDSVRDMTSSLSAIAKSAPDFPTVMRKTVLGFWSHLMEHDPGEQIMQFELSIWALRTPGMEDVAKWQYQLYLDMLTRQWDRAARRTGVTLSVPSEQLARLLLAGVDGLLFQYLTLKDAERSLADAEALVDLLSTYAAPRTSASD